ncbi:MAG: RNA methyltransferase [Clostridia bacterium]
MFITSSNNNYLIAKKLLEKKYRDEFKLFLIDGEKLIFDALKCNVEITSCFVDINKKTKYNKIIQNIDNVYEMEEKNIKQLTTAITPQGIIAICKLNEFELSAPIGKALILENIQDPNNIGAILRTAVAADYKDVYLCNCADVYSLKCIRSGMSAQFLLNLYNCSIDEAVKINNDNFMLCADMEGEDVFNIINIPNKHTIVLGNEGQGVSNYLRNECKKTVSIKMQNGLNSLNVAVSAGIIMYALSNRAKN